MSLRTTVCKKTLPFTFEMLASIAVGYARHYYFHCHQLSKKSLVSGSSVAIKNSVQV